MVVSSKPIFENSSHIKTCKPYTSDDNIPVIDMLDPQAKFHNIKACQELGFFKVVNHDVPKETMTKLEGDAFKFFNLPQCEKDKAGPANPFGYGNKRIGSNGDVGWIEYLLFTTNSELISEKSVNIPGNSHLSYMYESSGSTAYLACELNPSDFWQWLLYSTTPDPISLNSESTPFLAVAAQRNYLYPPPLSWGRVELPRAPAVPLFNTTSLQICLRDGTWVSVQPDHYSFFIIVGDSLQVMTNGGFRSVRHRVLANSLKSRLSMIYFGGPPLSEKIAPLSCLMEEGEESLYKEFTWGEYKKSAYLTRLGDNRLGLFEKNIKVRQYGHNLLI
ncbi:PREDICTED: gibberellin 2-beta-dioxygenase 1-like [Nicotiana attenuata]|uniref:gibberellin 2-beta-dioxygenase 1-like n=1 Tax=Nicotiana attenuata TaxID=49451 RepID=UPI0009051D2F|nr:PREDICTED: gibberellin 2-beta-dioxygenase 1-like [Nicotiana attenuata]